MLFMECLSFFFSFMISCFCFMKCSYMFYLMHECGCDKMLCINIKTNKKAPENPIFMTVLRSFGNYSYSIPAKCYLTYIS